MVQSERVFSCVAKAYTAKDLIAASVDREPSIILMGLDYPDMDGIMVLRALRGYELKSHCLVFTRHLDRAFHALQAGANGYINRHENPSMVHEAVVHIYEGREFVSDTALPGLITHIRMTEETPSLTKRELSVLEGLASLGTTKKVAADLYLSPQTVKNYTKTIYKKLGVHSSTEAVAKAMRLGILV